MRSFTPQISWHNRDPVLSLDIQNRVLSFTDNSVSYRLATSGNDSHVIVWKASINDKTTRDPSSAVTKHPPNVSLECLADLTKHQRPVNVVRFSPKDDDNLLAAGDDDCVIYIWKLIDDNNENQEIKPIEVKSPEVNKRKENCLNNSEKSEDEIQIIDESDGPQESAAVKSNPIFNEEEIANEIWKPYKILRGHIQDVSDICWSPDGQRLVSGSVDNTAIVWDIHKGQKLHKIVEHKGFVQGVTWDPMNKWLATLSADRSMRIIDAKSGRTAYRVHRMRTEDDKTSRLFYDDTLRSFCRRLAFTPGGEFLIAPSGILEINGEESDNKDNEETNKYINTTYIFDRKAINKPSFYLPSKKYTIAVSCCPKLYQLNDNLENPFPFGYRIVFAVATQDSVLFYDSQQSIPFACVSQIHYLRLTDISWSPDGRMLIVSSTDGFATFITFEANEIGIPYDGPKYTYELELETSSPVNNKKEPKQIPIVETTPEVDRTKPKVSTPSITTFFKPSEGTPEIVAKPLTSQNQSNCQPLVTKPDPKTTNILIPRKKIKLTTITTNVQKVETIDID